LARWSEQTTFFLFFSSALVGEIAHGFAVERALEMLSGYFRQLDFLWVAPLMATGACLLNAHYWRIERSPTRFVD